MRSLIVFNRLAGGGHGDRSIARAIARAGSIEVVAPTTKDELDRVARELRASRTERLGIVGGDGTVHAVLSALDRAGDAGPMPTIALLGGGTLNTIARSIAPRRRSLASALDAFREAASVTTIPTTSRATIRCNGAVGSLFGVGVVASFLREYYRAPRPSAWSAARLLATGAIESLVGGPTFRAFTATDRLSVTFDDGEALEPRETLAVAAGTIPDLGLGFRPFHRVIDHPGSMHLVRYHGDAASLVRALPKVRLARPLGERIADERTTRGFTIRSERDRVGYMFDGDLYEHAGRELRVTLGPDVRYATLESPVPERASLGRARQSSW